MACDYELGKFTFLDELEPEQEPEQEPQHCIRPKAESPEIFDLGVSSDEFLDARSLSIPSSPIGGKGNTDCPPIGGKGNTDYPHTGGKGNTDYPPIGGKGNIKCSPIEAKGDTDCPPPGGKGDTYCSPPGGKGNTDYPPTGGKGNIKCSPIGGKGNTDYPPIGGKGDTDCSPIGGKGDIKCSPIGGKGDTYCSPIGGERNTDCPPTGGKGNTECPPEAMKRRTNGLTYDLESPIKKLAIFEELIFFDAQGDPQHSKQQTNNAICKQPIHTNTCKQATYITPIKQTSKLQQIVKDSILSKQSTTTGHKCHWFTCKAATGHATLETLYDHVLADHIKPCEGQDVYMCQWAGCKVYNVPSSSYNGFKGHVLRHTKAKMYRCLIDECPASFRTIEGLAHHMEMQDSHFLIPSENKKQTKHKQNSKSKPKPPISFQAPSSKRQTMDTFSPIRRSRRLYHTPSFKKYFVEQESDDEDTSKPIEFLHAPTLLGIQQQAEQMTSCDLLHSMTEHRRDCSEESVDRCLVAMKERDLSNFQVLGQRMLEDSLPRVEYLCGFSKSLLDWIASNALPDFVQSTLSISIPEPTGTQHALRMRTNKRK